MNHAHNIELLAVEMLVPYAKNARTHSGEQIEAVARSIERFGFTNPVLIDADGGIVAGHLRRVVIAVSKVMARRDAGHDRTLTLYFRSGWVGVRRA